MPRSFLQQNHVTRPGFDPASHSDRGVCDSLRHGPSTAAKPATAYASRCSMGPASPLLRVLDPIRTYPYCPRRPSDDDRGRRPLRWLSPRHQPSSAPLRYSSSRGLRTNRSTPSATSPIDPRGDWACTWPRPRPPADARPPCCSARHRSRPLRRSPGWLERRTTRRTPAPEQSPGKILIRPCVWFGSVPRETLSSP